MDRRRFGLLTLGLAASFDTRARADEPLPKLRVAAIPIEIGALSYYAQQAGFYQRHGLDVEIVTATSGAAVAAAIAGGSLEVGSANSVTFASGYERGLPFVLLSPSGIYSSKHPTAALVVATASPLRTARDLPGKIVALNILKTVSDVAVRAWLDANGISSASVRFVEVPFSDMGVALQAGRVDAAVAEEPALSAILAGGARVLANAYDALGSEWIEGGYFCTRDYATAHPAAVRAFADAMADAAVWANANHDTTAKMLAAYGKAPVSPVMQRMTYAPRLRAAQMQPVIDASAKYGIIQTTFPARAAFAPGIA